MRGVHQSARKCTQRLMPIKISEHEDFCLDGILNAIIPLCLIDKKYHIRYANKAFADLFGKTVDKIEGNKCYQIWNCPLSDCSNCDFNKILNRKQPSEQFLKHVLADSSIVYYRIKATPYVDSAGNIDGLIISCIDITGERRALQSLKESEATARAFMNMPTDLTLIINPSGIILDVGDNMNSGAKSAAGLAIGKSLWDYFPLEVAKKRRDCLADVIRFKTPTIFEDECRGRWYYNVFHPIENENGDIVKITIYSREITKYKKTEEELKNANKRLETEEQVLQEKKIALKQLLYHIDEEKEKISATIQANITNITMPLIKKMEAKACCIEYNYIEQLKNSLKQVISPFISRLDSFSSDLTSREYEICSLVRNGMSTKEIASMLNISSDTVKNQRKSIRKKLGISGDKINLSGFLQKIHSEDSPEN
jgi:PAS domain S-box-containing protein